MFKVALIIAALVVVASARTRPCTQGVLGPYPTGIDIVGCSPDSVCRIIRGKDISGLMSFVSTHDTETLRPEITAYAFGVRAVYELPDDRQIGCDWVTGTRCPLNSGEDATYEIHMDVVEAYPLTELDIEIRLFNAANHVQFCVLVEAEVVLG